MINAFLSPTRWLLAVGTFTLCLSALAQAPASLDPSFNTTIGASGLVHAIALQPDGKVLIGGLFTGYDNIGRDKIARLNPDGTLDPGFNIGLGAVSSSVNTLAVQPDGKILVGGSFGSISGSGGANLARLLSNSNYDLGFNIGTGLNGYVQAVALQPNGKILIGGAFTTYNGIAARRLARLNSDGSLDSSFSLGAGANSTVAAIVVQPDGKILIGGDFILYNNVSCRRIARLNADGTLDLTFNPGNGADDFVSDLALQPDGKVVAVGTFISFDTSFRNKIVRLNPDGSVDQSFNPGSGADFPIQSVSLSGPMIVIGGSFGWYNGTQRNNVAFLNPDGSIDQNVSPGSGPNQIVVATAVQPDGRVLIGGHFTMYGSNAAGYLARIFGPSFTGLPEVVHPAFSLYPNPTSGQFTIDLTETAPGEPVTLTVYSLTGQQLWQQRLAPGMAQAINAGRLPAGLYELRIQSGQSQMSRKLHLVR